MGSLSHSLAIRLILLQNKHLAGGGEIARGQCVEINAAGNRLTGVVPPIPIGGVAAAAIRPRELMTQLHRANKIAPVG